MGRERYDDCRNGQTFRSPPAEPGVYLLLITIAIIGILVSVVNTFTYAADVRFLGRVQAEYSSFDIKGVSTQSLIDDPTSYSSFGVLVSENLSSKLKVIALIDYGFNLSSSNIGAARKRWVGFSHDSWGQLKFGRTHSPFADFAGGWTIDPFVYTALQAAGSGGAMIASANGLGSAPFTAVNSLARFESATTRGFSFVAMLMPGDAERLEANLGGALGGAVHNGGNTGSANGEWDFQVAGKYDTNFQDHRFSVFGGYSRDNISSVQKKIPLVNLKTEEVGRIGGTWAYKNFLLQGQYEYISNALGAATCSEAAALGAIDDAVRQCNSAMNAGGDGAIWFSSGQYKRVNTRLIVQGGMTDANSTNIFASRKSVNLTIRVFHDLSKRSSLFGGYQYVDVADNNTFAKHDPKI